MKYPGIREESVKKKVGQDFFDKFDTTDNLGNIDFAVKFRSKGGATLLGDEYLLWAEAKDGSADIFDSFTQLVLTIGQSGTVAGLLPPPFLGVFDSEKIAFVPYIDIARVFAVNDFNWKVTPSNYKTEEFGALRKTVQKIIEDKIYRYDFEKDEATLRHFIQRNLPAGRTGNKIQITKNNFIHIYLRWLDEVKPHIAFNWDEGKRGGILDCDFYRADLFVDDKNTENIEDDTAITDKLAVLFRGGQYKIVTKVWGDDMEVAVKFKQGGKEKYTDFWKKYKRPPLREYWDYIIDRRDLLVPQDIRERKGSFFTPQKWVALSQQYIADVLGDDWQDEYYVWDCCAGTGNLLVGLTNKYNIWASTLDKADVDVMHERIVGGADLLHDHVFQFDFLNDEFTKLPKGLQDIVNDPDKRKKLVVYINPPYAEADNRKGEGRAGVAVSATHKKYAELMGYTKREIYIQFLTRIYCELPSCVLANFSKLKNLQAPKFQDFRRFFRAKLEKIFVVPADTFDNVRGQFPIGFYIWNTAEEEQFEHVGADVYDKDGAFIMTKNQRLVRFGEPHMKVPADNHNWQVTRDNLIESSIYFTVRKIIDSDWLNDRDQFLYPNDGWMTDTEFQNDCLAYTLFSNNIQSAYGANHWIPFTEAEIGARDRFDSRFMTDFIAGKIGREQTADLFSGDTPTDKPARLEF